MAWDLGIRTIRGFWGRGSPEAAQIERLPEIERGHRRRGAARDEGLRVQLEAALEAVPDDPDLVPRVECDRPETEKYCV